MKRALIVVALSVACRRDVEGTPSTCAPTAVDDAGIIVEPDAASLPPAPVSPPDNCTLYSRTIARADLGTETTPARASAARLASGRIAVLTRAFRLGVYDPSTDRWSFRDLPRPPEDWQRDANRLIAAGGERVLVYGAYGCKGKGCGGSSWAVLHDFATGATVDVTAPTPVRFGSQEVGLQLRDGRLLIVTPPGIALLDPATRTWDVVTAPASGVASRSGVELLDGRVLFVGTDRPSARAHIFDPASKTFAAARDATSPRSEPVAVRLRDGRVLVAGGLDQYDDGVRPAHLSAIAEIYDPRADTWTRVASMPSPRRSAAAALLGCGGVLVAGGVGEDPRVLDSFTDTPRFADLDDALMYSPAQDKWTKLTLTMARGSPGIAVMADGSAFIVGGGFSEESAASAEWAALDPR